MVVSYLPWNLGIQWRYLTSRTILSHLIETAFNDSSLLILIFLCPAHSIAPVDPAGSHLRRTIHLAEPRLLDESVPYVGLSSMRSQSDQLSRISRPLCINVQSSRVRKCSSVCGVFAMVWLTSDRASRRDSQLHLRS